MAMDAAHSDFMALCAASGFCSANEVVDPRHAQVLTPPASPAEPGNQWPDDPAEPDDQWPWMPDTGWQPADDPAEPDSQWPPIPDTGWQTLKAADASHLEVQAPHPWRTSAPWRDEEKLQAKSKLIPRPPPAPPPPSRAAEAAEAKPLVPRPPEAPPRAIDVMRAAEAVEAKPRAPLMPAISKFAPLPRAKPALPSSKLVGKFAKKFVVSKFSASAWMHDGDAAASAAEFSKAASSSAEARPEKTYSNSYTAEQIAYLKEEAELARKHNLPWQRRGPRPGNGIEMPKTWKGGTWRPNAQRWAKRGGKKLEELHACTFGPGPALAFCPAPGPSLDIARVLGGIGHHPCRSARSEVYVRPTAAREQRP